jgi:selenocysteine lyase/cysteine desulfurase
MAIDAKLLQRIRREFPAATHDPSGRTRAFLDNGAGTLVTRRAAEREAKARIEWSANVGNVFPESKGAEARIREGRQAVADLLNADGPEAIISGESATSLLFSLSYATGRGCTGRENVVAMGYEHFANVSPWQELARSGRIKEVRFAPFDLETGLLDMDRLQELVDRDTRVVAAIAASNVLGTRSDLREIGRIAHDAGALLVVDAVHHIAHGPTDVRAIGCDALVFSGYKLFSRHGSFLYLRPELIERLSPYKVEPSPEHGPGKWEWGTRDQAMFAAIAGSVDYLAWLGSPSAKTPARAGRERAARVRMGLKAIEAYEAGLTKLVLEGDETLPGILDIPGLTLFGPKGIPATGRDPTFSFKLEGREDRDVSKRLWDRHALAVGAEDYYSRVLRVYGVETMVRATFVHYNTPREARILLTALGEIAKERH